MKINEMKIHAETPPSPVGVIEELLWNFSWRHAMNQKKIVFLLSWRFTMKNSKPGGKEKIDKDDIFSCSETKKNKGKIVANDSQTLKRRQMAKYIFSRKTFIDIGKKKPNQTLIASLI